MANTLHLLRLVTYAGIVLPILANLVHMHYWLCVLSKPPDGGTKCSAKLIMCELMSMYAFCFYYKQSIMLPEESNVQRTWSEIQYVLTHVPTKVQHNSGT